MNNPLIARFANEPSLLSPGSESRFQALLAAAAADPALASAEAEVAREGADSNFWGEPGSFKAMLRPYNVQNGILLIPVRGVLLHGFPYALFGWATGYEYISQALRRGLDDSLVQGIALVIDSPGGMVSGCFDLVDEIFEGRGRKPIRAFASEHAYSAAYAIFSAAEKGIVARTGGVGSIGVVTTHIDISKALDSEGVKITFIHAGAHKVDGNPYEPLPADVKARIQERIDELYGIFTSTVARNRGLDEEAVRATEALTFTASQSLSNGLADEIGSLDDALAAFAADLSEPSGDDEMSNQTDASAATQGGAPASEPAATVTVAERDTAVAEARTEERTRIAAILGSDEAKGRESLANHLALETDTGAEASVAILAKSLKASAEGGETPFNNTMNNIEQPEIGAGVPGAENEGADEDGEGVLALVHSAGIAGFGATKQ